MSAHGSSHHFDEKYAVPFERCLSRFREHLNSARCSDLRKDGFVVIDGMLGQGWALALLQEMRWLHNHGYVLMRECVFFTVRLVSPVHAWLRGATDRRCLLERGDAE